MDTSGDEGKQFLQIRKSAVGKILITHVQMLYSEDFSLISLQLIHTIVSLLHGLDKNKTVHQSKLDL